MTRRREIQAFLYLVLLENKLGGRLLEGEHLLETIRYFLPLSRQAYKISYIMNACNLKYRRVPKWALR